MKCGLLIETSTRVCSAGIYYRGKLVADKIIATDSYVHAESLMPCIHQVIEHAGISVNDLDAVILGEGPGSYTGLRIGTSLAKGICFGLSIPLYTVNSGQMFAAYAKKQIPSKTHFVTMSDAGRMEVYMAVYDQKLTCVQEHQPVILDEALFLIEEFRDAVFVGDGIEKASHWILQEQKILKAQTDVRMMSLAIDFEMHDLKNISDFVPLYVKSYTPGISRNLL
jgi:tRNA threonylcarbamoyladenosine biosynthesis protein TsaB